MGILDWLKRRHQPSTSYENPAGQHQNVTEQRLSVVEEVVAGLKHEVGTVCILLKRHDDQLAQHEQKLGDHATRLETLIRNVDPAPTVQQPAREVYLSPLSQPNPVAEPRPIHAQPVSRLDVDHFTEQQKRILGVFFQDKGRRMSYADVAAVLGKSMHTVKNQINQIRQKADLFEQMIGPENRNLFKLREDVRIEKYLNCGQPVERPASTLWPEPSTESP